MRNKRALVVVLVAAVMMLPGSVWAQHHDLTHGQPAATEVFVEFGIVPLDPLGPFPCRQTAPFGLAVGANADPCVHKAHVLDQPEVTVVKGGQVTFTFRNGGHSIAIYEVSKDTTRDHIGQQLCPATDPSTLQPAEHVCRSNPLHASAEYLVTDGKGDVVLHVSPDATNAFPQNLVTFTPGRLMSAGGAVALNGNAPLGHVVSYQFLKSGRYLVICMNRSHFLNDWMFGFVNVVGADE
jgi:hypothetical protein